MSEVTTLKQLMLDAARYRWISEHPIRIAKLDNAQMFAASTDELNEYIDEMLDRE